MTNGEVRYNHIRDTTNYRYFETTFKNSVIGVWLPKSHCMPSSFTGFAKLYEQPIPKEPAYKKERRLKQEQIDFWTFYYECIPIDRRDPMSRTGYRRDSEPKRKRHYAACSTSGMSICLCADIEEALYKEGK